jgi:predicted TIM-barrel fold metal-dependent hydrolase
MISRREWLAGILLAPVARAAATGRPKGVLIEPHVHLFSADQVHFPYNASNPVYRPPPYPLEEFVKFAQEVNIEYAVIVHPEPYQDDHRYLEYCLAHEPSKGFFKGTCLFDPIDPKTPERMQALVKRNPGRIVALRIHEEHKAGTPSTTTGPIRERDLHDPQMLFTWRAVHDLGLRIQLNFAPRFAPQIRELAAEFKDMPIILDHLGRAGQGTPAEYDDVLRLAELPRVYMKYTDLGVSVSSKQKFPYLDAKPIVKRAYDAFGADRMIWGYMGMNMPAFEKNVELFNIMFDFAPESERAKIRGLNSKKLFGFT